MEYLPSYTDSLYLEHHGIKGQRWGVRRFQNEDGTRTPAGRRRQRKWADTFNKAAKKANEFSELAKEDTDRFNGYVNKKYKDNPILRANIRISKRQAKRYKKLADKYLNVDYDSISKKDYKEAKKFVKSGFFTNADYAWVTDTHNYEDYD